MIPIRRAAGALALATASLALTAWVPAPVEIDAVFVDRVPEGYQKSKEPPAACAVNVVEVADLRRAKDTIGVVAGRSVKAPADTTAWLTSIMGGLNARGLAVVSDPARAQGANDITVRVGLKSVWLTAVSTNKAANVVLHIRAELAGRPPIDADYRGSLTNVNWASTKDELKNLTNAAFAEALNAIAPDLRRLCETPLQAPG